MRRRSMGVAYTPDMVAEFDKELLQYKNTLSDLYSQKSQAISNREAIRFHYLSGWRVRYENAIQYISTDIFNLNNTNISSVWIAIQEAVKKSVRMQDLAQTTPASSGNSGTYGIDTAKDLPMSLMNPLSAWFAGTPPAYKTVNPSVIKSYSINDNILSGQQSTEPIWGYIQTGVYSGSSYQATSPKKFPWSVADMGTSVRLGNNLRIMPDFSSWVNTILSYFTKDYGDGTLYSILDEGLNLYKTLLQSTLSVLQIQIRIDEVESQVSSFIAEFKATGNNDLANTSKIYNDMITMAKDANARTVFQTSQQAPTGSTAVGPSLGIMVPPPDNSDITQNAAAAASGKNTGLMMGLAAAAAFILSRGK